MKLLTVFGFAACASASIKKATKAPSYDKERGCWSVSVDHDATYCVEAPVCSGSGLKPTGTLCPVQGDVAIADCDNSLVSYQDGHDKCVLPVDATCQILKTGVWGCVIPKEYTLVKHKDSMPGHVKSGGDSKRGDSKHAGKEEYGEKGDYEEKNGGYEVISGYEGNKSHGGYEVISGYGGNKSHGGYEVISGYGGNKSHGGYEVISNKSHGGDGGYGGKGGYGGSGHDSYGHKRSAADPEKISLHTASAEARSAGGLSAGVIGAIAAVAAVVAAIAGVAIYRQRATHKVEKQNHLAPADVVTPRFDPTYLAGLHR
ncbi:hypothetical protein PsorP6_011348 [Peronosclerospora sorghi]|uniref:Uncharacterized protein n=1 Tax=Peronosclerospora sorghi TaxID=230839 RepID=A0ACC0WN24_9STRA|nr:hypothetical protein PsorP6_011348 [Peronosclerospora sorghi]